MALNDTFKSLPKKNLLKDEVTKHLTIKDFWAEECQEHPSKKECLLYCDQNLLFLRKFVNFAD